MLHQYFTHTQTHYCGQKFHPISYSYTQPLLRTKVSSNTSPIQSPIVARIRYTNTSPIQSPILARICYTNKPLIDRTTLADKSFIQYFTQPLLQEYATPISYSYTQPFLRIKVSTNKPLIDRTNTSLTYSTILANKSFHQYFTHILNHSCE